MTDVIDPNSSDPGNDATCRVCHGESQPDNPLFYPCRCDGSIKYVHQECLLQWIKYSRQTHPKCELCGEPFHFQNVYKPGAPSTLTLADISIELLPRLLATLKTVFNVVFSSSLWGVCLPLFTHWWFKVCWCVASASESDLQECCISPIPFVDSLEHLASSWYSGVVSICVIVAISVICFELGQMIYREIEIAERARRIKMLEKQLREKTAVVREYEEAKRMNEVTMFAINDYESLRYDWEEAKERDKPAPIDTVDPAQADAERVRAVRTEVRYTRRMAAKLKEVSQLPNLEHFKALEECYSKLDAILSVFLEARDRAAAAEPAGEGGGEGMAGGARDGVLNNGSDNNSVNQSEEARERTNAQLINLRDAMVSMQDFYVKAKEKMPADSGDTRVKEDGAPASIPVPGTETETEIGGGSSSSSSSSTTANARASVLISLAAGEMEGQDTTVRPLDQRSSAEDGLLLAHKTTGKLPIEPSSMPRRDDTALLDEEGKVMSGDAGAMERDREDALDLELRARLVMQQYYRDSHLQQMEALARKRPRASTAAATAREVGRSDTGAVVNDASQRESTVSALPMVANLKVDTAAAAVPPSACEDISTRGASSNLTSSASGAAYATAASSPRLRIASSPGGGSHFLELSKSRNLSHSSDVETTVTGGSGTGTGARDAGSSQHGLSSQENSQGNSRHSVFDLSSLSIVRTSAEMLSAEERTGDSPSSFLLQSRTSFAASGDVPSASFDGFGVGDAERCTAGLLSTIHEEASASNSVWTLSAGTQSNEGLEIDSAAADMALSTKIEGSVVMEKVVGGETLNLSSSSLSPSRSPLVDTGDDATADAAIRGTSVSRIGGSHAHAGADYKDRECTEEENEKRDVGKDGGLRTVVAVRETEGRVGIVDDSDIVEEVIQKDMPDITPPQIGLVGDAALVAIPEPPAVHIVAPVAPMARDELAADRAEGVEEGEGARVEEEMVAERAEDLRERGEVEAEGERALVHVGRAAADGGVENAANADAAGAVVPFAAVRRRDADGIPIDAPVVVHLGYKHLFVCFCYITAFMVVLLVVPAIIGRVLFRLSFVSQNLGRAVKLTLVQAMERDGLMLKQLLEEYFDRSSSSISSASSIDAMAAAAALESASATSAQAVDAAAVAESGTALPLSATAQIVEMLYVKFKAVIEIGAGYLVLLATFALGYFALCMRYLANFDYGASLMEFSSTQAKMLWNGIDVSVKVCTVLTLYGLVLPAIAAALLMKVVLRAVPQGVRRELLHSDALHMLFALFAYIASHLVIAHIVAICFELRQLIRSDLVQDWLPKSHFFVGDMAPAAAPGVAPAAAAEDQVALAGDQPDFGIGARARARADNGADDAGPAAGIRRVERGRPHAAVADAEGGGGGGVAADRGGPRRFLAAEVPLGADEGRVLRGGGGGGRFGAAFDVQFQLNDQLFFGLHERFVRVTYLRVLRRFLVNTILVLPGVLACVVLPFLFGHHLVIPFALKPLELRFTSLLSDAHEVHVPIEMILSHILIPLLIEKMQYRASMRRLLVGFFSLLAPVLDLAWILNPEAFPALAAAEDPAVHANRAAFGGNNDVEGAVVERPQPDGLVAVVPAAVAGDPATGRARGEIGVGEPADMQEGTAREDGETARGDAVVDDATPLVLAPDLAQQPRAVVDSQTESEIGPTPSVVQHILAAVKALPLVTRLAVLCACGFLALTIVSSWILHVPFLVGRCFLHSLGIQLNNDLLSYPVGMCVTWAAGKVLLYIGKEILSQENLNEIVRILGKWSGIVLRVTLLASVWLTLPPLLIGYGFNALTIVPIRTPLNESPQYPFIQCWAIGLVALKVWTKCVLSGVFGEIPLRIQLEHMLIRGFALFDFSATWQHIVYPVCVFLLDYTAVPYFLARVACIFVPSYQARSLLVRFCMHAYIATKLLWLGTHKLCAYLVNLHNEIRDSRYLIGTELRNRAR